MYAVLRLKSLYQNENINQYYNLHREKILTLALKITNGYQWQAYNISFHPETIYDLYIV